MELFSQDYRIRIDEADCTGRVTPVALLNFLQDSAYLHAADIGVSVNDLHRRNQAWVLSRYYARFFHYPQIRRRVRVKTWPSSREGRFTTRDFEITDENGGPVAAVTSSWALLDTRSRRPLLLDEALPDYPLRPVRLLEFPADKVLAVEAAAGEVPFRVRLSDLDVNQHVNHTVYIEWALESLPADFAGAHRLAELEIAYRAEALRGDTVCARYQPLNTGGKAFLHQLVNGVDGREFARLRTRWA
ncbi:MAG: acyl-ACP thioesterase domain-containing protein [Desulfuromonadales bacterium]|jgi:acyl-ACP thioesterase